MGKLTISMASFNSHVSLPEGISPKVAIVIGKIVGENEDQPELGYPILPQTHRWSKPFKTASLIFTRGRNASNFNII